MPNFAPFNLGNVLATGQNIKNARLQNQLSRQQSALQQQKFSQEQQKANTDWLINATDRVLQDPSQLPTMVKIGQQKGIISPDHDPSTTTIDEVKQLNQQLKLGTAQPKYGQPLKGVIGGQETYFQVAPTGQTRQVEGYKPPSKSPLVSVDLGTGSAGKEAGKMGIQYIFDKRKSADDAITMLQSNKEALDLLNSGMVTGAGADWITSFGKALQQVGFNVGQNAVDNAQAYGAAAAKRVASIIKAFGSGTGLSDADRAYAEKAAAGNLNMTEPAIRKILDINNRAAKNSIKYYNDLIDKTKPEVRNQFPFDPSLKAPEDLMNLKAEKTQSIDDLVNKYAD